MDGDWNSIFSNKNVQTIQIFAYMWGGVRIGRHGLRPTCVLYRLVVIQSGIVCGYLILCRIYRYNIIFVIVSYSRQTSSNLPAVTAAAPPPSPPNECPLTPHARCDFRKMNLPSLHSNPIQSDPSQSNINNNNNYTTHAMLYTRWW